MGNTAIGCAEVQAKRRSLLIIECEFVLVGIVLTYSKKLRVFRVGHIYKPDKMSEITDFVIEKGRDSTLLIPFSIIVEAFVSVYGPQIRVGWRRDTIHTKQFYLQLRKVGSPSWVGLDGQWERWLER